MIQNFTGQSNLEWHWGYAYRVVPCQSDPGSCAYLDVVYSAHDRGMLYTGIFWATILCILLVWCVLRRLGASGVNVSKYEMPLEEEIENQVSCQFLGSFCWICPLFSFGLDFASVEAVVIDIFVFI